MQRALACLFAVLVPLAVARAQSANDDCATPQVLVGPGPHAFDTTGATAGSDGQNEGLCLAGGSTAVYHDVWFTWTAPQTATFRASTCGTTPVYSKLVIYAGSGCPASGTAIVCFDRGCHDLRGAAGCFAATEGQTYTIQIGGDRNGWDYGPGRLTILPETPPSGMCAPADDGVSEGVWGFPSADQLGWMVSLGHGQPWTEVSSIEACFGSPTYPTYVPNGPVTVAVWDDPNDDGNITDGVLVALTTTAISPLSVNTDVFQSIPLPSPVALRGIFFVGVVVANDQDDYPMPLDEPDSDSPCGEESESWYAFAWNAPFNFEDLAENSQRPRTVSSHGYAGHWLLRATCGPAGTHSTPYCFGDGTAGADCPCGNNGASGRGCANSAVAAGASLSASGAAIVGMDTVVLTGSGMPATSTALYYQGTARVAVAFGDGLRCVGVGIVRLGTQTNAGGTSQIPTVGDPALSILGNVSPGATRRYQVWYRNSAPYCTAATFNLTNGVEIAWL